MINSAMTGVYPILQIPFDSNEKILEEELRKEVDWAIKAGVDGVGIAMGSEVFKLTDEERDSVLRAVVDQADGRSKVVMNSGGESTAVTINYSQRAESLGANALMIRPPSYMPAGPDEAVRFFATVAESVSIPIFLQDQLAAQVPPAMAVRLAGIHENLSYAKMETPPTIPRIADTVRLREDAGVALTVFGGANGTFFIEELRRGSVGTMPAATMPEVFVRLWKLWQGGQQLQAEKEARRFVPLTNLFSQAQGIGICLYKEMLLRRGIFSSAMVRSPATRPDATQVQELHRLMDELELEGV